MVKFDTIKPDGWNTITLTEDIEFSIINIAKGQKLGWATDAIVYDEQPVGFKQSWSQRSRWSVGHLQIMKHYIKDLAVGVKKHKTLMNFDGFLYMMGFPMMGLTFLLLAVNTTLYMGNEITGVELILQYAKYLFTTFILPIFTAIASLLLDKRKIKPMLKGIICYPLFLGSWLLINIKCLVKPNTKWEKIEHVRNIEIKEKEIA
jgi:cellulose synthase/poly-beta-1,6-N-acetylglucosamine synthase-like glycosyltransferase